MEEAGDAGKRPSLVPKATELGRHVSHKEKAFNTDIPLPFVIDKVTHKVTASRLYSDLVLYVPFVIMFIFFAYGGRGLMERGYPYGITEGYYTTEALKSVVLGNEIQAYEGTRLYENIRSAEEWHAWFATVLVPGVFSNCGKGADPTPPEGPRKMQGLNYLLGAIRVRAQRASNRSCVLSPDLYGEDPVTGKVPQSVLDNSPCYGRVSAGEQRELLHGFRNELVERKAGENDTLLYQWQDCSELEGGQSTLGYVESSYHCGGYIVDVAFDKPCYVAEWLAEKLDPKGATPLVDDVKLRFIIVEFFVYSPMHNAYTSVKLFAEVSPGGTWLPQYQVRNFLVWTASRNTGQTIFDFFFFIFVLYFCYAFIRDLMRHKNSAMGGSVMNFIVQPWNLMELLNLLCFLVSFAFRWAWWDVSMQSRYIQLPFPPSYPSDLDKLLTFWSQQTYANSINITVSLLKVLKYLRLNPRLGILTSTIDRVKIQLLGVLVLFTWSVLAYALAGFSLYGSALWEFRTVDTGFTTLMRMLAGDFEGAGIDNDDGIMELRIYPRMRAENRVLTFGYFFSYVLLVFFFLLNMMIGILGLGFSELNATQSTVPFSEEILRFIRGLRRSCSLERIRHACELIKKGKSTTNLLERSREHMLEHQRLVKGENQDVDDSLTQLRRAQLPQYMGTAEHEALGAAFCDDLWCEIVQEWEDSQDAGEAVEQRTLESAVSKSVDSVIDPMLDQIRVTQMRLTSFEQDVQLVLNALSKRKSEK
eukprot:Hpha_TRINITY_DN27199_c0_g1::TRINITY_DN27199_c0_g1_i1::g.29439::m.29439/K04990/PKD2L1; polycystin 2L1